MVAVNPQPSSADGPRSSSAVPSEGVAPAPEPEASGEAFATHLANAAAVSTDEILDADPLPDGEGDVSGEGVPTPPAPPSPTNFGAPPTPPAVPADDSQYTTDTQVDPALSDPQVVQLRESLGITPGIARVIRMAREHVPEGAALHIFNSTPAEFSARFQVDPNVPVTAPTIGGPVKTVPGPEETIDSPFPPPPPPPPPLGGFDLDALAIPAPPAIPVDEVVLDDGADEPPADAVPEDDPPLPPGISSVAQDPGASQSRAAAVYQQSMSRPSGASTSGVQPVNGQDGRRRDA